MTLYKWGRFERKENYKEYYEEYLVESRPAPYDNNPNAYDSWAYYKLQDKETRDKYTPKAYYKRYYIENGKFVGYGEAYPKDGGQYVITDKSGIPESGNSGYGLMKNYETKRGWDAVSEYVFGDLYNLRTKKVLSGYKKGSRLDTVTSTNRNAYPNDGESGSYWYVYEGIANQTPSISGQDEDLGGFKAPFKKVFSVNDPDNNETLNVTVKLNSATIRTINNATKGESYEIDIDKAKFDELELNKSNTIEITVSDSNAASAIRRYTFKKVNSNPVVTVTNSNLGEQNKPFNFSFKAADPDGDDITVKVYVDDVQLQDLGKVTPDQSKTVSIGKLDYAKLLNGEHRIKIEATDSFGARGTGYITFSKKIDYCWYRLTKEVDAQPSAVVVNPLTELAKGAKMTVKVSLNAKDTNPTWEVLPDDFIGQKYNFKTKSKTADKWCIGVDIRIDRADTPEGMESYFYGFVGAYM